MLRNVFLLRLDASACVIISKFSMASWLGCPCGSPFLFDKKYVFWYSESMEIRIVDNGKTRYTLQASGDVLGRMYDNKAESVVVIKPAREAGRVCTMIVTYHGTVVDHIDVGDDAILVTDNLSQYESVEIGFSFSDNAGYIKNSEMKTFVFLEAQKPNDFVPTKPEQSGSIDTLLHYAFADVDWKEGVHNILQFRDVKGKVLKEIDLHGYTQEQADLGETDTQKETFVKGKKTSNLQNDGDGISPFATEQFVRVHVPDVDFSEIEEEIDDVRAVAEGKTKSFTVASLTDLGTLLGIDTSVVSDEYSIISTTINYKEKSIELKQGDLFLIVDTNVPDYWVSVDDMKIYKMETTKVDLTDYVKNTDYVTSTKAGLAKIGSSLGIWVNANNELYVAKATNAEIDSRASNYKPIVPASLDYAVNSVLKERVTLTLKDNGAYTLTINKE